MKRKYRKPDENQPDLPFESGVKFRGLPWYPTVEKSTPSCCVLCGQPTNLYRRLISAIIAKALIKLYRLEQRDAGKETWHHIRDIHRDRSDWAKLRFWGLIEEAANQNGRSRTSGLWRITAEGRRFVLCQEQIPKYALVRFGSVNVGFCGEAVTIRQCLEAKNEFSYTELMESDLVAMES